MPQNFVMILMCLDDFTYQVSSSYKVLNLLAMANMYKNTPLDLWGLHPHFGVPRKPPFTHLKNFNQRSLQEIILIILAKNLFRILKNEVRNQRSSQYFSHRNAPLHCTALGNFAIFHLLFRDISIDRCQLGLFSLFMPGIHCLVQLHF